MEMDKMQAIWHNVERLLPWLLMFGVFTYQHYQHTEQMRGVRDDLGFISGEVISIAKDVDTTRDDVSAVQGLLMMQGYLVPPMEGFQGELR